jgi:hypothetical protein
MINNIIEQVTELIILAVSLAVTEVIAYKIN